MNVFKELERFCVDRKLDKMEFSTLDFQGNILEELFELDGYDVPKKNRTALKEEIERFTKELKEKGVIIPVEKLEVHYKVDSLNDIMVFCNDGLLKQGYNPEKTLLETSKEVNSRVGTIINGKFEKDLSMSHLWYKADYSQCKRD